MIAALLQGALSYPSVPLNIGGMAVIGALLWWRIGHMEKRVETIGRRTHKLVSAMTAIAVHLGVADLQEYVKDLGED